MIQVEMGEDDGIDCPKVGVSPQFGKWSRAEIQDDPGRSALDQVAATALAGVWSSGASPKHGHSHVRSQILADRSNGRMRGPVAILTEPTWLITALAGWIFGTRSGRGR